MNDEPISSADLGALLERIDSRLAEIRDLLKSGAAVDVRHLELVIQRGRKSQGKQGIA